MPEFLKWVFTTLVFLLIILPLSQMPVRLTFEEGSIIIKKVVGRVIIPSAVIVSLSEVPGSTFTKSTQIIGSGGLFGFIGRFSNKGIGEFTALATRKKNLLLVRTIHKNYVFNCDRRRELLKTILEVRPDLQPVRRTDF
ncbi:MAG: PH domain-containing protein [Rikenellaceae bacterium]|nr:PH domain-containing protein [Rikenellaceae bacterium]